MPSTETKKTNRLFFGRLLPIPECWKNRVKRSRERTYWGNPPYDWKRSDEYDHLRMGVFVLLWRSYPTTRGFGRFEYCEWVLLCWTTERYCNAKTLPQFVFSFPVDAESMFSGCTEAGLGYNTIIWECNGQTDGMQGVVNEKTNANWQSINVRYAIWKMDGNTAVKQCMEWGRPPIVPYWRAR